MSNRNNKGYIAFTSILVISAVVLAIAAGVSFMGISEANTFLGFKKGKEALYIADSCIEDALVRVRDSSTYSSGSLNVGDGSCTITVTRAGQNFTIDAEGLIAGPPQYRKKIRVTGVKTGYHVNVLTWSEIP